MLAVCPSGEWRQLEYTDVGAGEVAHVDVAGQALPVRGEWAAGLAGDELVEPESTRASEGRLGEREYGRAVYEWWAYKASGYTVTERI